jgi:adenine-specific DNA-methyltransferase
MEINLLNLRHSINKAYLKVKPNRTQIETFKKNIKNLFDQIKESESEEFHKNIISEFLKNTYYSPVNYINTKGRYDLVIHNGKDSKSTVGVLFETKKPSNKSEMPTCENINTKAFQELILYYLRERITNKNLEIKYLVATNIFEWFIFNANDFEKLFASDKKFVNQFQDFENERLSGKNTDFFYKNIAEPFIEKIESQIALTYFDIRDFETIIKNADNQDDKKLIALYKILSPEHLLKLPFANDSNNLDKTFYNELLHIIGLEETKEGSRKIIGRKIEKKRNQGSLIENAITILNYEDCLTQLPKLSDYANSKEEQLFNISLELVITWINRILFLKLLEGQLIKYNNGDETFQFLNIEKIHDFDELNKLFFQVLAVKESDRSEAIKQKFSGIPYLNSSLFEPSDLEHKTIRINSLDDHLKHPVIKSTVLKDKTGKKLIGEINPLQYLFDFLDSYDFASEGSEDIQEENKTLINASVLGLIFEKINGYKDGAFFTPGFITMYMCHETISRAIVQKFNEFKSWKCETISDVYNKIEDINEANRIVNSIKICDPAVGSGHFLVSALNEIIAIKSELKILMDREGKKLKEYTIEVINDELILTDEQSKLFEYNPKSKESQRVQEVLFKEKQEIIEKCLFGVDINPNSVKICRLRLWIELLKNAYYKQDTNYKELETLPNIDINIKCGNSLISRYPLDADIKTALKSSKWNVDNYREAVMTYRNAQTKDEKRSMEQLINKIKNDFETEVSKNDKRFLKLNKLKGELLNLSGQSSLFEMTKTQKEEWNKKLKKVTEEIKKYEAEIEDIKSNKIYDNAFEWRFEFPEVLNNDGDFMGFDVVIGNPPYIDIKSLPNKDVQYIFHTYKSANNRVNLFSTFIEKDFQLLRPNAFLTQIIPTSLSSQASYKKLREIILKDHHIIEIVRLPNEIFGEHAGDVKVDTIILFITNSLKQITDLNILAYDGYERINEINSKLADNYLTINQEVWLKNNDFIFSLDLKNIDSEILAKCEDNSARLEECAKFCLGITPYDKYKGHTEEQIKNRIFHADFKKDETFKPLLLGNDVKYYQVTWNGKTWISYGDWLGAVRQSYFFTSKRILVKQIIDWSSKRIWAALTDEELYNTQNAFTIIPTDSYSPEYILAILNSKLITYYHRKKFLDKYKSRFQKILIKDCKLFPIKIINKEEQARFIPFVNKILYEKKRSPKADTNIFENQIDKLVYKLYGLAEEEIRIVES